MVLLAGLENYIETFGYLAIFALLVINNFVPIPEDLVLLLSGWLVSQQILELPLTLVVGFFGAIVGDNLEFYIAHKIGKPFLEEGKKAKIIKKAWAQKFLYLFDRHPYITIFLARFAMGLRWLAPMLAGTSGIKWRKFFFFNALGAVVSTPIFVTLGYFFGEYLPFVLKAIKGLEWVVLVVVVIVVAGILLGWFGYKKYKKEKFKT